MSTSQPLRLLVIPFGIVLSLLAVPATSQINRSLNFRSNEKKEIKLKVLESNNEFISPYFRTLPLPVSLNLPEVDSLRNFILSRKELHLENDPQVFFDLTEWVALRWKHDGAIVSDETTLTFQLLRAAEQGVRFNCADYSRVLVASLQAFGFPARNIYLNSADVEKSVPGVSHAAVEVYSNTLKKWIFLDPQFGVYVFAAGKPLSFIEIARLLIAKKEKDLRIFTSQRVMERDSKKPKDFREMYVGFLAQYTHSMQFSIHSKPTDALLTYQIQDNEKQFLVLQGGPAPLQFFTRDESAVYFPLNQVLIAFDPENFQGSSSNYSLNQSGFPAESQEITYRVRFGNNTAWFASYEIRIDDNDWAVSSGSDFSWKLHERRNTIAVRTINEVGIRSAATRVVLEYFK